MNKEIREFIRTVIAESDIDKLYNDLSKGSNEDSLNRLGNPTNNFFNALQKMGMDIKGFEFMKKIDSKGLLKSLNSFNLTDEEKNELIQLIKS